MTKAGSRRLVVKFGRTARRRLRDARRARVTLRFAVTDPSGNAPLPPLHHPPPLRDPRPQAARPVRPGRALPSRARRSDQPLSESEFLAVDTETNGLNGDLCEMTEVGAVLVGGGELHETWESLTQTERPLQRGIQRFTGITQAMVDSAPPPAEVLPELAELIQGRVLVAHNARFDDRVLRGAFERQGIEWPDPPVVCTVALARRFAPLVRRRGLASLADALGIEVDEVHRALPDALTCARVFCALFPKLCANAPTVGDALDLLAPRRGSRRREEEAEVRRSAARGPARPVKAARRPGRLHFSRRRGGRCTWASRVRCGRGRARRLCARGLDREAEIVDFRPTNSELGALVLENRLIKQWQPHGNRKFERTDATSTCAAAWSRPTRCWRWAAADGGPRGDGRAAKGRKAAGELADQLTSLFRLRHCGKALPRRDSPSAYGQMGRCLSPCWAMSIPTPTRPGRQGAGAVLGPDPTQPPAAEPRRGADARGLGGRALRRAATLRRRAQRWRASSAGWTASCGPCTRHPRWCSPAPRQGTLGRVLAGRRRVADWARCRGRANWPRAPRRHWHAASHAGRRHCRWTRWTEVRMVSSWLADHSARGCRSPRSPTEPSWPPSPRSCVRACSLATQW